MTEQICRNSLKICLSKLSGKNATGEKADIKKEVKTYFEMEGEQ